MTVPAAVPAESLFDESNAPLEADPNLGVQALTPSEAESLFGPPRRRPARRPARYPADPPSVQPRTIRPIETEYAGHRFRSRLEARWAVFFDHLGIRWQYEPEGYEVGPQARRRRYLPDFYLTENNLWVEVKGHAGAFDATLLIDAAHPTHGLPTAPGLTSTWYRLLQPRVLVLGPVPRGEALHDGIVVVDGETVATQLMFPICGSHGGGVHCFIGLGPAIRATTESVTEGLLAFDQDRNEVGFSLCRHARDAYRAARMARFEHGESGAPSRELSPSPTPSPVGAVADLARFVESRCSRGADAEIRPVTFRSAYAAWCEARKVSAVSTKDLTTELRRFGVTLSKGRRPRVYLGVALRESAPSEVRCRRCAAGDLHHLEPDCDRPEREGLDGMDPSAIGRRSA